MVFIPAVFTEPLRSSTRPTLLSYSWTGTLTSLLSPSSVTPFSFHRSSTPFFANGPRFYSLGHQWHLLASRFLGQRFQRTPTLRQTSTVYSIVLGGICVWHPQLMTSRTWISDLARRPQSHKSISSPVKISREYLDSPVIMGTWFWSLTDGKSGNLFPRCCNCAAIVVIIEQCLPCTEFTRLWCYFFF